MRVSTPEATALDLVRYVTAAGHIGNVATVLAELSEKLTTNLLSSQHQKRANQSPQCLD
jgi:hypothetical protein